MKCAYHPDREAVGACVNCGRLICDECKIVLGGKIYCNPCADKEFVSKTETGILTAGNTSGQGNLALIPREIQGWNWGAFLLNWIWALGNSVWVGLLALIPYVGLVMAIVLGVKGNEWAWRCKRWDSIEHFKRTQSKWAKWGLVLLLAGFVLGILIAVISALADSSYLHLPVNRL